MDFIKSLLSDFDFSSLLPKLDSILSKVELLARIVVMAGPVILLVLGLWYLLLPPKEANYAVGYRFFWGMSSVESWRFTQFVAGIVWSLLGLVLSLAMYLLSGGFKDKPLMDIIWKCVEYVFWEMGLLAVSCLVINLTVVFTFNSKGERRREKKRKDMTDAEILEDEVKHFVHNVNEKLHQKPSLDKVKAAGAALLPKKKETAPLAEASAMPALEQPAEPAALPVAEETPVVKATPVVEEIPAVQEAPAVEAPAAEEAPEVIPVAVPVAEETAEEVPGEEPAAQEAQPEEEKPSVLDKVKALFAALAGKLKELFASLKSKKKTEAPEQTPAEEAAQEETVEEAVEAPAEEAVEAPAGEAVEAPEETAQAEAKEEAPAQDLPAEEAPAQPQLPLVVPPSQQRKNPYGTKKRYPKGTKKKGKK